MLAVGAQPQIESSDGGIAANSRHGCHIQHPADLGAATPDRTTAAHISTVAVKWCETSQCGNLLATEHSQLQAAARAEYSRAHCRHPARNAATRRAHATGEYRESTRRVHRRSRTVAFPTNGCARRCDGVKPLELWLGDSSPPSASRPTGAAGSPVLRAPGPARRLTAVPLVESPHRSEPAPRHPAGRSWRACPWRGQSLALAVD